MDAELEYKLILCLDALEAGESIDAILASYPADATALRPLLETAAALPALILEPEPQAQIRSRRAFLNRAAELRPTRRFLGLPLRMGLTLATLLLALTLVGAGSVAAANAALPGDPLYGFKRVTERVQLALASDKLQATQQIAERRREEISALIAQDRSADVEFSAQLQSSSGNAWRVGDLLVQIDPQTQIAGDLVPGAVVIVRGRLEHGQIYASAVLPDPSLPLRQIVPTPRATRPPATRTSTPTPTWTPVPTATQTTMPTHTQTAIPTGMATATAVPTALPASTTHRPVRTPSPTLLPPTEVPPTSLPAEPQPGTDDNQNGNDSAGNDPRSGHDNQHTDGEHDGSPGSSHANDGGASNSDDSSGGPGEDSGGGDSGGGDSGGGPGQDGGGDSGGDHGEDKSHGDGEDGSGSNDSGDDSHNGDDH